MRLLPAALLVLMIAPALANPPAGADPNSPLGQWFTKLQSPRGGSCCDQADGRITDNVRSKGKGLEALIDKRWGDDLESKWVAIPDETILQNQHNPTGRWIVFYHHIHRHIYGSGGVNIDEGITGNILCVVPPEMS